MKALYIREHGGLEALNIENLPDPQPKANEVLVEVKACSINHLDIWVRKGVPGARFPLPLIPGSDIAGIVKDKGELVYNVEIGQKVILQPSVSCGVCPACLRGEDNFCKHYGILGERRNGGHAELIAVPAANILPYPDGLSFEEAAAIPLVFLTAWHMLVTRAKIKAGETILIQAAGSGVSSAGIQIAKLLGATVFTTASMPEKLEKAKELGADEVINYKTTEFDKEIKRLTNSEGVDVVFDHVGVNTWEKDINSLKWGGRLVICGATSGPMAQTNLVVLFFKALSLLGSTMGSKAELHEIMKHVQGGKLKPVLDSAMKLEEAREAHRKIESREVFGKIVLCP